MSCRKISTEAVLDRVRALASLDSKEAALALPFCRLSAESFSARLKNSSDAEDFRVVFAAAADAFYAYMLAAVSRLSDGESIRIGDVTVKNDNKTVIKNALSLRDYAVGQARCLLSDEGFYFRGE